MSSESFSPTKGSFSPSKNSRSRLASESSPRKSRKYNSVSAIGNAGNGQQEINAGVSGRTSKMSNMSSGMKRNKSSANSLVPCTGPGQMDDYIKYVKEGD